ncbi:MAG: hypothetical protein IPK72_24055 [Candidatus Eisenbacteria bacterium]|nr:hypothetical protein [Candidatus Eisenbacteria bacterium]
MKDGSPPALSFEAEGVVASIGLRHQRPIGERLRVDLGLTGSRAHHTLALDPAITLRYRLDARSSLVGAALRTRQFQQSLRNPESLVSRIFPIELQASSESDRIPDLESDLALLALETRITPRWTATVQFHDRALRGLALVAPNTEGPFATQAPVSGRPEPGSRSESAISGDQLGVAGGYVYQWTRYRHVGGSYVPSHAARHQLTLGEPGFPPPPRRSVWEWKGSSGGAAPTSWGRSNGSRATYSTRGANSSALPRPGPSRWERVAFRPTFGSISACESTGGSRSGIVTWG